MSGQVQRVCIVGISGKLGQYMLKHCLDRGYQVNGVCRAKSVGKLDAYKDRITLFPGATDDPAIIEKAVAGCQGVLVILVPWGVHDYSSGTAKAVLRYAEPGARLIFSCGWHITLRKEDKNKALLRCLIACITPIARCLGFVDLDDQVRACDAVFASDTRWTVVRGSSLTEGESEGLPVWADLVSDPILASDSTRRIDFALFMVHALENEELVQRAPAINGCKTKSALKHGAKP